MAWMVLVPLSWFVARYYKETFFRPGTEMINAIFKLWSKTSILYCLFSVLCLQEYWWYMWHVGLMVTAAVFGLGGFVSIESRVRHETLEINYA